MREDGHPFGRFRTYLLELNECTGSALHNLREELAMKTILSALVALSFLAGIAGPSNATSNVNAKKFFEKLDKEGRGGQSR